MLRNTKHLLGYKLATTDGSTARVKDFLFDEDLWSVRWLVAETGAWLPGRKVLIAPTVLGEPDWNTQLFPVRMSKSDIENAPGLATDEPVSRKYEKRLFDFYEWPYYWDGANFGQGTAPPAPVLREEGRATDKAMTSPEEQSHVLRSTDEVTGYHIQAIDDHVGHVEDFILDDQSWKLRYVVVDTRNWLPGRKVLVAPDWIEDIACIDNEVSVGLKRDVIKDSPEVDPSSPVSREYEKQLYDYYGRPAYWQE